MNNLNINKMTDSEIDAYERQCFEERMSLPLTLVDVSQDVIDKLRKEGKIE